jgi:prepilin peptidase CpaA
MFSSQNVAIASIFFPVAIAIAYMDVRYRRIPNRLVLVILIGGVTLNTFFGGWQGLAASLGGLAIAFGAMFFLHLFGTMGAGDVKFFAAIGSVIGISLVPKTFLMVAISGGLLALCKMIYARRVSTTVFGVIRFFYGLLPGQTVPRFEVPTDRNYTLPYALPICIGSVLSFLFFRA